MFCSIKFWVIKPPPWNCQQHHFGGLKKAAKNWRQNMLRWWSSWMTDCFLLDVFSARFMWWRSTMTLNSNKALLIHDSNTKTMTHQNLRSFSSFHGISRFGLTVSFTELVHQKTNVHHVWPKAVSRPKRASYHWAASKFGRGTTRGNSTGHSAVWSDVTQHLDSVREIDIESWAQSFVNILVYTFFF